MPVWLTAAIGILANLAANIPLIGKYFPPKTQAGEQEKRDESAAAQTQKEKEEGRP